MLRIRGLANVMMRHLGGKCYAEWSREVPSGARSTVGYTYSNAAPAGPRVKEGPAILNGEVS